MANWSASKKMIAINLDKRKNHTIEVVIDRLLVKPGIEHRLEMSVGLAMKLAGGLVQVAVVGGDEHLYSEKLACPDCGINVPQLEPRSFSFNSTVWGVPGMSRPGKQVRFRSGEGNHRLVKAAARRRAWAGFGFAESDSPASDCRAAAYDIDLSTPFEKLPEKMQDFVAVWRAGKRRQNRLSRHFRISEAESGGVELGRLSRLADGSHVGHGVSGVPRQAAASGESGGEGEWHVDRRLHCDAGFARAGGSAEASS